MQADELKRARPRSSAPIRSHSANAHTVAAAARVLVDIEALQDAKSDSEASDYEE
jgi:hypothetical protein